jgi:zinc transport system ATP-binding protein
MPGPAEPTAGADDPSLLVALDRVAVSFGTRGVLDEIALSLHAGEIVTVIGPNGAGKTTLIRVVLGLVRPTAGAVRRRPGLRIGYMPQTVDIERTLPLTVRRFLALGPRRDDARVAAVLDEVGAPRLVDRSVHELSGGERKRMLLARALLADPDLLVLDEPTANVDVAGQGEFYDIIGRLRDRRRCGVLLVSHDLYLVMAATDIVVCLNRHICCSGQPDTIGRHPEYLALFGPRLAATLGLYAHAHDHRHALSGEPVAAPEAHRHGHEHEHG